MKENPLAKKPHQVYKDVVVIGNGPSGLSMSYVLAGHAPVYNGRRHPDVMLDAALRHTFQGKPSITDADLSSLACCLESRSSSTPLGLLLDQMTRPGADSGSRSPSLIEWTTARPLSHVVIGNGPPGGTWQKMDGRTMTLSLSSWMELPGLPLHESDAGRRAGVAVDGRVSASTVAEYYTEYVSHMGLSKYLKRGVVSSVVEYDDTEDGDSNKKINWIVEGRDYHGKRFSYLSKFVVLACGTNDSPNELSIPGESLDWVHHSTRDLDEYLKRRFQTQGRVLVVGSGLSSCDGVLAAKSHGANVLHLYRGTDGLARWLPLTAYPEYQAVHELMVGSRTCPGYRGTNQLRLVALKTAPIGDNIATLESLDGTRQSLPVSAVAILVGSAADLSFLPRDDLGLGKGPIDSRSNPLDVNLSTFELNRLPYCYALGPLAGDMFVRHILGGVVAAAAHIRKST